jgi:ubiquinone/menaquinone biosynthesis C-methylase UbiE
MDSHLSSETLRLQREKEFHDKVFADPSERNQAVGRFYTLTQSVSQDYHQLLLQHSDGSEVIEYGCGMGSSAFLLAQHGAKIVTGIDISPVAIDIAKADLQAAPPGGTIEFRVMNAENLEFDADSADLICGTGILHHLDIQKAIESVSRVLKPEGTAIFMEPLGHSALINLFRRLTPQARTEDEHPLLESDLKQIQSYFAESEIRYYYLTTLAASLFVGFPGFQMLRVALENLDQQLFKLPFLKKQAWIVLIWVAKPLKQ